MKKLLFLFSIACLFGCQQEASQNEVITSEEQVTAFSLVTADNPELHYEKLKLIPIIGAADFIANQTSIANFLNLEEALEMARFRITEKKPYGRFNDAGAVNSLTIQNKTQDTIFLMAGDLIQGGRQDRVLAMDMIVPPRTITDIPVFCVEPNRWHYQDENKAPVDDQEAKSNKNIYAFNGYYNVASNDIRKTVMQNKNQQEVWDQVGRITQEYEAGSQTGAYAALEESEQYTLQRDAYLRFFEDKFLEKENVIGIMAVSGKDLLGADIFGHPNLFQKQYKALLHSYVTGALMNGATVEVSSEQLEVFAKSLKKEYIDGSANKDALFSYAGKVVHFTQL